MRYRVFGPEEILETSVVLPLSKSVSARVLMLDALAGVETRCELADCDDTRILREALTVWRVGGTASVNVGDAGTAMRFATAFYATEPGADVVIDGSARMRERPVGVLVEALRRLGADIEYMGEPGHVPLHVCGHRLKGGVLNVDASVSSQFISALALVGCRTEGGLRIVMDNVPVSLPYVKMTVDMLAERGVPASLEGCEVSVAEWRPRLIEGYEVERDWSAASYWYGIAALTAGWVTFKGLKRESLQGDRACVEYGERLGVLTDVDDAGDVELSASPEVFSRLDLDMTGTPDLVPAFAVASAMLGVPFRFSGVHTLHDKETDRVEALTAEALKLGFVFESEGADVLTWEGRRVPIRELPVIATYGDHRMAMAFAMCGVYVPGIVIEDVEVVSKSYPGFWEDLRGAGFTLRDFDEELKESSGAVPEAPTGGVVSGSDDTQMLDKGGLY